MQSEHNSKLASKLSFLPYVITIAMSLLVAVLPLHRLLEERLGIEGDGVVHITGTVKAATTGEPISLARVQLLTDGSQETDPVYTDAKGNFSIPLKAGRNKQAVATLSVKTPAYSTEENVEIGKYHTGSPDPIVVAVPGRESGYSKDSTATKTVRRTLGPVPSGNGAAWSDWYTLCAQSENNYRIQKASFELLGDRNCNGWAECQPREQSPYEACWRFRMQGHSESSSVGMSMGVITLTEIRGDVVQAAPYYISIRYHSDSDSRLAYELAYQLRERGLRVVREELVPEDYPSTIHVNGPRDQEIGDYISDAIRNLAMNQGARTAPVVVYDDKPGDTPSGAIEISISTSR